MAYTPPANLTGLEAMATYIATELPIFGSGLLLTIFVVLFLAMKERFTTSRAFAGSSFVVFLVAGLLRSIDIIGNPPWLFAVAGLIIGALYVKYDTN